MTTDLDDDDYIIVDKDKGVNFWIWRMSRFLEEDPPVGEHEKIIGIVGNGPEILDGSRRFVDGFCTFESLITNWIDDNADHYDSGEIKLPDEAREEAELIASALKNALDLIQKELKR